MKSHAFLPIILGLTPAMAGAQDAASALARAQNAYDSFVSLRADFTQIIVNRMIGEPDTTSGTLFLSKPHKFAMKFAIPAGDRLVADGNWLWVYTPQSVPDQVIRQPIPTGGALTPNLFGQFVDRATERYVVSYGGSEEVGGTTTDVLHLVPNEPAQFRAATIAVARDTGLMVRVEIREESGQNRVLFLTNINPGAIFSPEEVRFDVPPGTRVVVP